MTLASLLPLESNYRGIIAKFPKLDSMRLLMMVKGSSIGAGGCKGKHRLACLALRLINIRPGSSNKYLNKTISVLEQPLKNNKLI
jgi:hypothetical protein